MPHGKKVSQKQLLAKWSKGGCETFTANAYCLSSRFVKDDKKTVGHWPKKLS